MKNKLVALIAVLALLLSCVPVYAADTAKTNYRISDIIKVEGGYLAADVYGKVILKITDEKAEIYAGSVGVTGMDGAPVGIYNDDVLLKAGFTEPWAIVPFMGGYAVSDASANVIRLIYGESVSTLAGTGKEGSAVGKAQTAAFNRPTGLATDEKVLYVADTGNNCIKKITSKGEVSIFAGNIDRPTGLCYAEGKLYVCETGKHRILTIDSSAKTTVLAGTYETEDGDSFGGFKDGACSKAMFNSPQNVKVDTDGTVYVADSGNGAVRYIKNGRVYTILSSKNSGEYPFSPRGLMVNADDVEIYDISTGTAFAAAKEKSFTDVASGYALKSSIDEATRRGIVAGVSADKFNPKGQITRAAFVVMLSRVALNADGYTVIAGNSTFKDVPDTYWCKNQVSWAADLGIVQGTNGKFNGSGAVTREQAVAFLYRYAKAMGVDVSVGEDTNILSYDDATKISSYAIPALQWACGAGILSGYKDGTLRPKQTISRAEAAAIFTRIDF